MIYKYTDIRPSSFSARVPKLYSQSPQGQLISWQRLQHVVIVSYILDVSCSTHPNPSILLISTRHAFGLPISPYGIRDPSCCMLHKSTCLFCTRLSFLAWFQAR